MPKVMEPPRFGLGRADAVATWTVRLGRTGDAGTPKGARCRHPGPEGHSSCQERPPIK